MQVYRLTILTYEPTLPKFNSNIRPLLIFSTSMSGSICPTNMLVRDFSVQNVINVWL